MQDKIICIFIGVIALSALVLAVICLVKKEKYDVLVADNGNNVGLQSLDLATKAYVDSQIDSKINQYSEEADKKFISNNDKVLMSNSSGGWLNWSKNHGDGDHPELFKGWAYWSTEIYDNGREVTIAKA